jgi:hypothetical protein
MGFTFEATCPCGLALSASGPERDAASDDLLRLLEAHQRKCVKAIPFIQPPSIWDGPKDGSREAFDEWNLLVDMRLARGPNPETAQKARNALVVAGRADLAPA